MAIDKLEHFATILGNFSLGVVIGGFIVFYFTKPYLISYLTKKAENLATKEDIASITDQVELVKSQYSVILENIKAKNQLRLAALDKRLQVHQEAFTLWRELFGAIHSPDIGKAVIICQEWWGKNCIYLEPEVRRAFTDAYTAANMHASILQSYRKYTSKSKLENNHKFSKHSIRSNSIARTYGDGSQIIGS